MKRALICLIVVLAGCPTDEAPTGFAATERVVTIADNVAANPSWSQSWVALLGANDDALFPAFAGADLATRTGAELVRLESGGDSYYALGGAAGPACVCGSGCGEPCLDPTDDRPTVAIVELGSNDLVTTALSLLSDADLRDDLTPAIAGYRADVRTVLGAVNDGSLFPTPPRLLVTNVPDPSDGVGDVAELITSFFPFEGADQVTPELALELIAGFNTVIAEEAAAAGAELVDLHSVFLGHGYHSDDEAAPHYVSADPTRWYSTVIDPNLRGAHEIRRAVWRQLTDEAIDAIPTDLPIPSTEGLPTVPAGGWAEAVVDSAITAELVDGDTTYPNLAADPEEALGAPGGTTGSLVAVGTVGAWFVVDLGADGVATDGEGEDLVVLEFGAQSGGTPEPYRTEVSESPTGPWTRLGDAFGERAFDLADAGVTRARYVRVESLAQEADVLGGLGSPYYPGPEIDAVGAVYPAP